jgi:hypothetical protein
VDASLAVRPDEGRGLRGQIPRGTRSGAGLTTLPSAGDAVIGHEPPPGALRRGRVTVFDSIGILFGDGPARVPTVAAWLGVEKRMIST